MVEYVNLITLMIDYVVVLGLVSSDSDFPEGGAPAKCNVF